MGDFSRFVRFEVWNKAKIHFWHKVWYGDQTLKEAFPVLFSIAQFKEALVANHMLFVYDTYQWNITFILFVHDWEMELVTSFFNL
jgi:hypothetical protein